MTFDELREKIHKANSELFESGLSHFGYKLQIEFSIKTYAQLVADKDNWYIRTEVDTPTERIHKGTVFGVPFILTTDTDRILIAKEIENA